VRQINFVVIFVICLALALFSLQNTDPATIRLIKGLEFQAPLAIELIVAMGIGAVLAWVFNVWAQVQKLLNLRTNRKQVQQQEVQIQSLEHDVERYKAVLEEQRLLPSAEPVAE